MHLAACYQRCSTSPAVPQRLAMPERRSARTKISATRSLCLPLSLARFLLVHILSAHSLTLAHKKCVWKLHTNSTNGIPHHVFWTGPVRGGLGTLLWGARKASHFAWDLTGRRPLLVRGSSGTGPVWTRWPERLTRRPVFLLIASTCLDNCPSDNTDSAERSLTRSASVEGSDTFGCRFNQI